MRLQPPINKLRLTSIAKLARPNAKRARQAFTLVEMLLTTSLVLLLASVLVFSFSTLLRSTQLEEGAGRLESVIRFARAQAANSGRKVQIVFEQETPSASDSTGGNIRLNWEPDPLDQPGRYEELVDGTGQVQGFSDLVQVKDVQLLEATGAKTCPYKSSDEMMDSENLEASLSEPFSSITFYPDGSSDSAEIILASRALDDDHQMAVRLVGLTGSISHHPMPLADSESPVESEDLDEVDGAPQPK